MTEMLPLWAESMNPGSDIDAFALKTVVPLCEINGATIDDAIIVGRVIAVEARDALARKLMVAAELLRAGQNGRRE
jgi:hypothetical protein